MTKPVTTPQDIGLDLVKALMTGKQPCKHSDALWEAALRLLNMPWTFEAVDIRAPIPFHSKGCIICGEDHGELPCPSLIAQ